MIYPYSFSEGDPLGNWKLEIFINNEIARVVGFRWCRPGREHGPRVEGRAERLIINERLFFPWGSCSSCRPGWPWTGTSVPSGASSDMVVLAPKVYHFGRLEMELSGQVLKHSAHQVLSDLARDMILENFLDARRSDLGWPSSPGVRQSLAELIDQVRSAGLGPFEFEELAKDAVSPPKLAGFLDIYKAYQDFLHENGLFDRSDRRRELVSVLKSGPPPRFLEEVREVIVRDFARFTPFQLELINVLTRLVERVEIHLTCPKWLHDFSEEKNDAWKGNPFTELLSTVRSLEAAWQEAPNLDLVFDPPEERHPFPLNRLSRLFQPVAVPETVSDGDPRVEIVAAPGRYAEVEHIGRRVWRLIDQGIEPDPNRLGHAQPGRIRATGGGRVSPVSSAPVFPARGALEHSSPGPGPAGFDAPGHLPLEHRSGPGCSGLAVPGYTVVHTLDGSGRLSLEAGVSDERAGGGWTENLERLALKKKPAEQEKIGAILDCIRFLKERLKPLAGARSWPLLCMKPGRY